MNNEKCQPLKSIQYQTMLNYNIPISSETTNIVDDDFCTVFKKCDITPENNSWNKLNKSEKMIKINEYISTIADKYKLNNIETINLKNYLSQNLDKKALQRNKDVTYLKGTGIIENIPTLHFNSSTRKFTLRKLGQPSAIQLGPTKQTTHKTPKTQKAQKGQKGHKNNKSPIKNNLVKKLKSPKKSIPE